MSTINRMNQGTHTPATTEELLYGKGSTLVGALEGMGAVQRQCLLCGDGITDTQIACDECEQEIMDAFPSSK